MNLTDRYLKLYIRESFKLHAGTWNHVFCVRSYEWDDDTWAFTEEDFNCAGISPDYVRLKLKEAGAESLKTKMDSELFLFDTYKEAELAVDVMNNIWFKFYKEYQKPITIVSEYLSRNEVAI